MLNTLVFSLNVPLDKDVLLYLQESQQVKSISLKGQHAQCVQDQSFPFATSHGQNSLQKKFKRQIVPIPTDFAKKSFPCPKTSRDDI
jgi:hypothetical protein